MRPLTLRMAAFGPFGDEATVDFKTLTDRGLFLICGPTGAGKTSILDGMTFALYGDSSGGARDAGTFRSHHAAGNTRTEVELVFALGEATYRVVRRAEHERPKKRGSGTTTEPPDAELIRLAPGDERLEASGVRKVDAAVETLLGFSADQFRQVVILPQGRFRRILTVGASEREAVLKRLFGTERYEATQERLRERARRLEGDVRDGQTRRRTVLEGTGSASLGELTALVDELKAVLERSAEEERRRRVAARRADEALASGRRAADRLAELESARVALEKLEERADEIRRFEARLEQARAAASAAPAVEAFESASRRREEADVEAQAADRAAVKAGETLRRAAAQLETWVSRGGEVEQLRARLAELEAARGRLESMCAASAAAETADAELHRLSREADVAKRAASEAADRLRAMGKEQERLVEVAARRPATAAVAETLERLQTSREKLSDAVERHGDARGAASEAEEHLEQVRQRRRAEAEPLEVREAARLARGLRSGEPCPVCGSTEHPSPAVAEEDGAEPEMGELERLEWEAEGVRAEARERLAEARSEERRWRERVSELEADLEDAPQNESELRNALVEARRREAEFREAAQRSEEVAAEIERLRGAGEAAEGRRAAAEDARREAEIRSVEARARAEAARSELPADLVDPDLAEAERKRVKEELSRLEEGRSKAERGHEASRQASAEATARAEAARQNLERARRDVSEASERVQIALEGAGFAGVEVWRAAHATAEEIEHLSQTVEGYQRDVAVSRDRLERAARAAAEAEPPDLEGLREDAQRADEALEEAVRRTQGERGRLSLMEGAAAEIRRLDENLGSLEDEQQLAGRLAEVAAGRNALGATFQRWALGAFLDDVLTAANQRLIRMTHGRFELLRERERHDQRRASGLDLAVLDHDTGAERPAETLSGGEGFLAALALALGLADVVQSYTGGVHLDTLFVDEGFGMLDPEALDQAMAALVDLRAGRRAVGIISHVPELGERIDARLRVVPGRSGSSIEKSF